MNELIQYLKGYQAWRRGQDERTMSDAGINPLELGQMLDATIETLEAVSSNGPILVQERKIAESLKTIRELRQERDELRETISELRQTNQLLVDHVSDDFDESLGAAIDNASASLPEGYVLKLEIENGGYACRLLMPGGVADVDGETIVDEIEALVKIAIDNKAKRFP